MIVRADEPLAIGLLACRMKVDGLIGSFFVKLGCRLEPGKAASPVEGFNLPSGDVNKEDEGHEILFYPNDFVPYKPFADIILVGSAHAPGAKAVRTLRVSVKVGKTTKSLEVVGQRFWKRSLFRTDISEPQPFVGLPINLANAFGGPGFAKNPFGKGWRSTMAPTIEHPHHRASGPMDHVDPYGFGPIPSNLEPRKSKVGTYKRSWLKDRWPWFPEDFDWSYFNAAPADQQIEGYLRGDEELEFENLHPKHPIYKSRLPGLRTRCFLNERLPNGELSLREVKMNLDTLWINTDEEKVILVWRGLAPVRTLKLREIENILVVTEPLSEPPRSLEDHRAEFLRRLNQSNGVEPPKAETAAADVAIEKRFADMDKEFAAAEQEEMGKMEAEANKAFEESKAQLIAQGVDPKLLEDLAKPKTLAEAKVEYQAAMAELERTNPEHAAKIGEIDFGELEKMEKEMALMEAEIVAKFPPPPTRESVQAILAGAKSEAPKKLSNQDLSGLDLSGMNFAGADLSGANLSKAKLVNANFAGANLTGANLSSADLTLADLNGATLDEADLSKAVLVKAKLTGLAVAGATFSKLDLSAADFSGCHGKGADFSKANLVGARFVAAKLPQSDFSAAILEKADFSSADLRATRFDGVKAKEIQMVNADISGLRGGDKADFTGGNFRGATGAGSIWEKSMLDGADFSKALLTRANFSEASLREARFDRADAMKASFDDACLQRGVLTNANLLRATFDRADLTQTNFMNANLYGAGFWETVFLRTVIDGANVKETQIKK